MDWFSCTEPLWHLGNKALWIPFILWLDWFAVPLLGCWWGSWPQIVTFCFTVCTVWLWHGRVGDISHLNEWKVLLWLQSVGDSEDNSCWWFPNRLAEINSEVSGAQALPGGKVSMLIQSLYPLQLRLGFFFHDLVLVSYVFQGISISSRSDNLMDMTAHGSFLWAVWFQCHSLLGNSLYSEFYLCELYNFSLH